ncbi:MAG: ribbon-helix-helix domain-containing protein [Thermoplasmata archaeon]|nr:ribbon-helix-helix domain-containing protein [Thermoplasmata archaeon]
MRSARPNGLPYFLGVRLSEEELRALDEYQRKESAPSRSDAVRRLVRGLATPAPAAHPLPVSVERELGELVEDGWVTSEETALTLLLELGLREFSRLHAEQLPALRGAARGLSERSRTRKRADRASRGLLER